VTIRNGRARFGGGILNNGGLTINNSTISGNSCGSGHGADGGGIFNIGRLKISNSTISGNGICGGGGGIGSVGTLTINNSTISGNSAIFGSSISSGGTVTINNSTISGNHNSIYNVGTLTINNCTISGNGGGITNVSATVTLQNSIVANNPSGGNCRGTMTSNGYNLSSDNTCNFNGPGDLNNTDPKLGKLGNYGGPTQTIPLLSGSPSIDAGNPNGCTDGQGHLLKTDQRGKPRPDKEDTTGCDRGAYERQKD
jgi:hypothetical protein